MRVLLHICCGVCAGPVVERLMCEGYEVTGFFYNPNIHPVDEYQKRLNAAEKVAQHLGFELIEGPYEREKWFPLVKGKEYEPEGGERCRICFEMRLRKAYKQLLKGMFDRFATTLTVSPVKNVDLVNNTGREINEERFICADFKKKNGSQRAVELARELELYRQTYCGCIYSLEQTLRKKKEVT